jgi:tetratricopeptide (TPR) repeat protein
LFAVAASSFAAPAPQQKPSVESLIKQSRLSDAERELQSVLKANPRDAKALNLLGVVRLKQGKYIQAEKSFVAALKVDDKSAAALENLGALLADEERYAEATTVYERFAEVAPQNEKALAGLATVYQKTGEYQKSLDVIAKLPSGSRPDKLLGVSAADLIGLKRMNELDPIVREILQKSVANPELVPQLAKVFVQSGMAGDANQLLRIAGTRQKKTAAFLAVEAEVLAATGNKQAASAAAAQALALDPRSKDALMFSARLAGGAGEWKIAAEHLKTVWKSAPPTPDLLQRLVYASMQFDDLETAHNAALELNELQPDSTESWLVLAVVLVRASHWGEADALLQRFLEQKPDDRRAQLAKGACEYNLGKLNEAQKHLTSSLGQGAPDAEAHYVLGLVAKQNGDVSTAAAEMEKALALDSDKAKALSSLGQLYLQLGEAAKARDVLEKAVVKLPQDAQGHYQLAQAYRKLGIMDKAKEQMELFQKLSARKIPQPAGEATK